MKKHIFFLLSLFSLAVFAQWVELEVGVSTPYLSDVYASNVDVAIAIGANGTIIKTTDGGETWEQKTSGTTQHLRKMQFLNPNVGYIIGGGGVLLKTTDGGETWAFIETRVSENFVGLSVVSENILYVAYEKHLLKSDNGGNTWQNINYDIMYVHPFFGSTIQFFDNQLGFVPNSRGGISKTEDGGNTWQDLKAQAPIYFINKSIGFYYSSQLFKSLNGGANFNAVSNGSAESHVSYCYAYDENTVWVILGRLLNGDGSTRGVLKISSTDSEIYTEKVLYDDNTQIDMRSVHFANESTGYIVGASSNGGAIWKNSTGINEGLGVNEVNLKNNLKIYPNPTSSEINIVLDSFISESVIISLVDMTGKQIYSNSFQQNQIKINTADYPKGNYVLTVKTEKQAYSKKIIIN